MSTKRSTLGPALVEPRDLPFCVYPTARDIGQHGLQALPASLPLADFIQAGPYRSARYSTVPAVDLTVDQLCELARNVGASFAQREPQCRHLRAQANQPESLAGRRHSDPLGADPFGTWNSDSILHWFIRLLVLTDPTSPMGRITANEDSLSQSVAIVDADGGVIGGALNETMPPVDYQPVFRDGDPFLGAVLAWAEPILAMLAAQDAESVTALCEHYPGFRNAYARARVGHHFMVARTDALPKADAFELVAGSAQRYATLGFEYMLIEATNQWTGAACELLGAVRVHFSPFQIRPVVPKSAQAMEDVVSSATGFLSDKDSGSMFYVLRLV